MSDNKKVNDVKKGYNGQQITENYNAVGVIKLRNKIKQKELDSRTLDNRDEEDEDE